MIRMSTVILFFLAGSAAAAAQIFETAEIDIRVEAVETGLVHPWGMTQLPDGSILVTERRGRLWRLVDGELREIANLPGIAAVGQGGLLDIAADEDFDANRKIYFTWSQPGSGGYGTALSSATLSADFSRLENVSELFSMEKKTGAGRHFGSRIVLAPDDMLFITTGDRGDGPRAQDFSDHAGAVIRLRRDGSVPSDNPFAQDPDAQPELWSKGHRNPQGADWIDGELWTVEHGAQGGDEINVPKAGRNYGWPRISYGRHYSGAKIGVGTEAEGLEQPVYFWDPSIAPSGMAVYDSDLISPWRGDVLVGALKYQMLVRLDREDGRIVGEERLLGQEFGRIRDVDVFADGAVYLLTDEANGQLLRITPAEE